MVRWGLEQPTAWDTLTISAAYSMHDGEDGHGLLCVEHVHVPSRPGAPGCPSDGSRSVSPKLPRLSSVEYVCIGFAPGIATAFGLATHRGHLSIASPKSNNLPKRFAFLIRLFRLLLALRSSTDWRLHLDRTHLS